MNIKGFRTVAFGFAVATVPAGLNYLVGVDWTKFGVQPLVAFAIGTGVVLLRKFTDTALGATLTGGSNVRALAICDATSWKAH